MKFIKLTTLDKTDIAIAANKIISIEKGDYDWELEAEYGFTGRPTKIITKYGHYIVRENFELICERLGLCVG